MARYPSRLKEHANDWINHPEEGRQRQKDTPLFPPALCVNQSDNVGAENSLYAGKSTWKAPVLYCYSTFYISTETRTNRVSGIKQEHHEQQQPPFTRLSQKLIAALKKGKEATPLLNPQENYNVAIIGVYSAPEGGVAVYDIDYLIDARFRSYKEEIQDSLKLNEEELREDAEKHITSYALRVAKGMYGVRGPIIVRKARDIEEDVTKDYLAVKGQRYSVLESGEHFKKKDREGE